MEFGAGPTRSAIFFSYIIFSVGSIKSIGNIHPDPDMSHDLSKISKILHPVHGHECHEILNGKLRINCEGPKAEFILTTQAFFYRFLACTFSFFNLTN